MKIMAVILGYLKWHYGKAIRSIGSIWWNFLSFIYHFFSINLLFKNFFDPWKRMSDGYPSHFSFKAYLFTFLVNLITRFVGMIMRAVLIIIGLAVYILFGLLLPIILTGWLILPPFIIFLIGDGLYLITK